MKRRAEVQRLKDEAAKARARGKYKQALAAYEQLERLEPNSASWPKGIGEMHRRLGQRHEAVAAWTRATERFARAGFLVKAIAVCHLILRQEPGNTEAQRRLAALNQEHTLSPSPLGIRGAAEAQALRDAASTAPAEITARRGAPLVEVPLDEVVVGAVETAASPSAGASITEIPIAWEEESSAPQPAEMAAGARDASGGEAGDDGALAREATRVTLSRTPLFSDLPADSLERLIAAIELVEIEAGDTVFREGDPGDALYVLAEGKVAVRSAEAPAVLAELGEGAFFGEIALVTDEPRSATVEAVEPTELLRVSREVVSDLVRERREVLSVILSFLRERLVERLVSTSALFAPFAGDERRALAHRFRLLQAPAGAELIVQGSRSGGLFILLCGGAEILRTDGGQTRRLAALGRGGVVGEISLLTGEPAVASVRTTAKLLALEMPADVFREVIMTHPQVLAFVGDLAEARRRALGDALAGGADYSEETLSLL